jgi:hypothetical protein
LLLNATKTTATVLQEGESVSGYAFVWALPNDIDNTEAEIAISGANNETMYFTKLNID